LFCVVGIRARDLQEDEKAEATSRIEQAITKIHGGCDLIIGTHTGNQPPRSVVLDSLLRRYPASSYSTAEPAFLFVRKMFIEIASVRANSSARAPTDLRSRFDTLFDLLKNGDFRVDLFREAKHNLINLLMSVYMVVGRFKEGYREEMRSGLRSVVKTLNQPFMDRARWLVHGDRGVLPVARVCNSMSPNPKVSEQIAVIERLLPKKKPVLGASEEEKAYQQAENLFLALEREGAVSEIAESCDGYIKWCNKLSKAVRDLSNLLRNPASRSASAP
jgi:hypothetical protein